MTIIHNWNFSRDFPQLPEDLINRTHYLDTIANILTAENPIVFLEGDEGDGATTTLAQFCRQYPDNCFSLFIKPASRFAYSLDYLRMALAEQFYWYINGNPKNFEKLDVSEFNNLVLNVRKKQRSAILYFVIDGLNNIPKNDHQAIEQIFSEVIPFGVDNYRFLISGNQETIAPYLTGGIKSKPYQQLKFQPEEAKVYLSEVGLQDEELSAVQMLCKGVPGRISAVKRLLTSGTKLSTILDSEANKYLGFIKLEFDIIDKLNEEQQKIVATIAFSKINLSAKEFGQICKQTEEETVDVIKLCTFLVLKKDEVEFISESHRKFAEKKLEKFRKFSLDSQLEHLMKEPRSKISLRFIPTYYEILNKQEAIIELLSKEHYKDLLNSTESISALRNRADLGAKSAASLKQTNYVFRFSLQKSIFFSAENLDESEAEIAALVSIGKSSIALTLANRALVKEDRLSLLASYARRVSEKNGKIDSELLEVIKKLVGGIEFKELGDKAIRIAANILIFDADTAIGIIEDALKGDSKAKRDAAYTHAAVNASLSKIQHRTDFENKAIPKITDESMANLARSFEILSEKIEVSDISRMLTSMPATHRIYFLRSIIKLKADDENIIELVDHALDVIIRQSDYTPKSKDLAELAAPFLTYSKDNQKLKALVERFVSQMGLVAKTAYSRDLALLQMRLAAAEMKYDVALARNRIEEAYFEVLDIKTPEAKLQCFGILLSVLRKIDTDDKLEKVDGFRAAINADIKILTNSILNDTGDHVASVAAALKSLAIDDPIVAAEIAARFNTETARNHAHALVMQGIASLLYKKERWDLLQATAFLIKDKDMRSGVCMSILTILESNTDKVLWIDSIQPLRDLLIGAQAECLWEIWMLKWNAPQRNLLMANFEDKIDILVNKIDSLIDQSGIYFKAAEVVASFDEPSALRLYEKGVAAKSRLAFGNNGASNLLSLCLSLVSRAAAPLAAISRLDDDTLARFHLLSKNLPSNFAQVSAYSELIERVWCSKNLGLTVQLVEKNLIPLLDHAKKIDDLSFRGSLKVAFPSLSVWHLLTAFEYLNSLEAHDSDEVLYNAALLRLRKVASVDPGAYDRFDYSRIDLSTVIDILSIANKISNDSLIYTLLSSLISSIKDKSNRLKFTNAQKADWANRIRGIVASALPDQRNIQHSGYKITCFALSYSIEDVNFSKWEELETQANDIPNIADRGYVFQILATLIPSKHGSHRKRFLAESLRLMNLIPSQLDRAFHLAGYAVSARSINEVVSAKDALRSSMQISLEIGDDYKAAHHRRYLIDIADQIDPSFADELVEFVDDDPARAMLKSEANDATLVVKTRRKMANAKNIDDVDSADTDVISQAAWKNLAELNAGRIEVKSMDIMTEYVARVGSASLHDAYPMLSWHIENMAKKFKLSTDVMEHLSSVCESLLISSEIAISVIDHSSKRTVAVSNSDTGLLVPHNGRIEAIRFVEEWIRANAVEYIKYCDPFFSVDDIPLLRIFLAQAPSCKVSVLANRKHLEKEGLLSEDPFMEAWSAVCSQDPPETDVIAISNFENTKGVIHDRWLITKGRGLSLGTSFKSLGEGKLSEVSEMDPGRASIVEATLDQFITRQRIVDGLKMGYVSFTL